MTLKQLIYFCKIAECQSFSRAAKELFAAQPSISYAIHELEDELGFELFVRSRQGVVLTEMGALVYRDTRDILEQLGERHSVWKRTYSESLNLSGRVRIAALPSAYDLLYEQVLPYIRRTYPRLDLQISELLRDNIAACMDSNRADLCVSNYALEDTAFLGETRRLRLRVFPLLQDELMLGVKKTFPASKKEFLTPEDTRELTFVHHSSNLISTPYFLEFFRSEPLVLTSYERIKQAIAQGDGVGVLPERISHTGVLCPDGVDAVRYLPMAGVHLPIVHFMACFVDKPVTLALQKVMDRVRFVYSQLIRDDDPPLERELSLAEED